MEEGMRKLRFAQEGNFQNEGEPSSTVHTITILISVREVCIVKVCMYSFGPNQNRLYSPRVWMIGKREQKVNH